MKKLLLLICAAAISSSSFCQENTGSDGQKSIASLTYRIKAKKQKTAAWICLGGGFAFVTASAVIGLSHVPEDLVSAVVFNEEPQRNDVAETILAAIGTTAMLSSIPLFISAAHNKHKAKLVMTEQKTAIGLPIVVPKTITSLTLRIFI